MSEATRSKLSQRRVVTLADLAILIAGASIAMAFPELHHSMEPVPPLTKLPPWLHRVESWEEVLQKVCVALLPLVLWWRARAGGVIGPFELIVAACIAPMVVERLDGWVSLGPELDFHPSEGLIWERPSCTYWCVRAAAWTVLLISIAGAMWARRTRTRRALLDAPGRGRPLTSFDWISGPMEDQGWRLIDSLDIGEKSELALWIAGRVVVFLVPAVIGAAAVSQLVRERGFIGGMGWLALALGCAALMLRLPLYCVEMDGAVDLPGWSVAERWSLFLLGPIIAAALGLIIAVIFGAPWHRWATAHTDNAS